jgi:hypothetical protein
VVSCLALSGKRKKELFLAFSGFFIFHFSFSIFHFSFFIFHFSFCGVVSCSAQLQCELGFGGCVAFSLR